MERCKNFREHINRCERRPVDTGTKVTFVFTNIPKGIDPKDNEDGTKSTLEKLARYVEPKRVLNQEPDFKTADHENQTNLGQPCNN